MVDLSLSITPAQDRSGYLVELTRYEDGVLLARAYAPPLNIPYLRRQYLAPMHSVPPGQFPHSLVQELGEQLASVLLPTPIVQALYPLLQGDKVRLRLYIPSPSLASLPWEYACTPEGFPFLHPSLLLVRRPCTPVDAGMDGAQSLRVLVVSANPGTPGYPLLTAVKEEVAQIRHALMALPASAISIEHLDIATPTALYHRLKTPPAPHIVHFIGHSDARPSGAFLVLHGTEPGTESLVFADQLAQWLPLPEVKMVVLTSCLSAGAIQGIAETLSQAGVPLVVAMQAKFRDQSAPGFAGVFYAAIARHGAVDEALCEARRRLHSLGSDWGTPVAFLNSSSATLFSPKPPAPAPVVSVPFAANPDFVGRQGFLVQIHRALCASEPVALVGLPGIGKTQAAAEYARAFANSYPGGVFWLDASSSQRLIEQYVSLAPLLGEAPHGTTVRECAQAVRERLSGAAQETLIVLDNLSEATESSWIPHGEKCRLLVTTRRATLVQEGYRVIPVPPLDEEASLMLLQCRCEARCEGELQAARQLARLVGHMPLALSLIASHVARLQMSFEDYLHRMQNPLETLQQARYTFQSTTGHDGSVYDALSVSVASLTGEAKQVLETAAVLCAFSVNPDLLAELCGSLDRKRFEEAVSELRDATLAMSMSDGRLRFHELVRLFASERAAPQANVVRRRQACAVLARWFAEANEVQDWARVREETETAQALISDSRVDTPSDERRELMVQLALALTEYSHFAEAVHLLEEALSHLKTLHPDKPMRAAWCMKQLGYTCEQARLPEKSLYYAREALRLARQHLPPSAPEIVEYLTTAGYVLKMNGDLSQAQIHYEQALRQATEAYGREHATVATILNNLGTLHEAQGNLQAAMDYLRESLDIDERLYGRRHIRVAIRLNNIGRVLTKSGQYQQAMECHQQAACIYERTFGAEVADVGESLVYLGDALRGMRDVEGARAAYCRALDVFERLYRPEHPDIQVVRRRLQEL